MVKQKHNKLDLWMTMKSLLNNIRGCGLMIVIKKRVSLKMSRLMMAGNKNELDTCSHKKLSVLWCGSGALLIQIFVG